MEKMLKTTVRVSKVLNLFAFIRVFYFYARPGQFPHPPSIEELKAKLKEKPAPRPWVADRFLGAQKVVTNTIIGPDAYDIKGQVPTPRAHPHRLLN